MAMGGCGRRLKSGWAACSLAPREEGPLDHSFDRLGTALARYVALEEKDLKAGLSDADVGELQPRYLPRRMHMGRSIARRSYGDHAQRCRNGRAIACPPRYLPQRREARAAAAASGSRQPGVCRCRHRSESREPSCDVQGAAARGGQPRWMKRYPRRPPRRRPRRARGCRCASIEGALRSSEACLDATSSALASSLLTPSVTLSVTPSESARVQLSRRSC